MRACMRSPVERICKTMPTEALSRAMTPSVRSMPDCQRTAAGPLLKSLIRKIHILKVFVA